MELIKLGRETGNWSHLIRIIGQVFSVPDSLIHSFRTVPHTLKPSDMDPDKDNDETETEPMLVDKSPVQESKDNQLLAPAVMEEKGLELSSSQPSLTVDMESLRRSYEALISLPDQPFQAALINALIALARTVEMDFKYNRLLEKDSNYLNIFVIVMEYPNLHSPEYLEAAFPAFCKALGHMSLTGQAHLARVWANFGACRLTEMLHALQQLITVRIINNDGRWGRSFQLNDDDGIVGASVVMKLVYYASLCGGEQDSPELLHEEQLLNETDLINEAFQGAMGFEPKEQSQPKDDPLGKELKINPIDVRKPLIPHEEFINESLNEHIDISTDYAYYQSEQENKFSFIRHNFVLTTASKHMSMYFDNRIRMLRERRTSLLQTIMHGGPPMPYLRIRVRRDHVVDDALVNVSICYVS